jgi:hypothetical protein
MCPQKEIGVVTVAKEMTSAADTVLAAPPAEIAASSLLRNWSFTIRGNGSIALAVMVQNSPNYADNE